MTDQRFQARLKQIDKRLKTGAKSDLLAGVGERKDARKQAQKGTTPWISLLIGGAAGYGAFWFVNQEIGIDGMMALIDTPDEILPLAQSNMMLAGAGSVLALIAVFFVYAILQGEKARKTHAFCFAGVAGALIGGAVVKAQPQALLALLEGVV